MEYSIRTAEYADTRFLPEIEQDAAQLFRLADGLEWLADQQSASAASYFPLINAETVWIVENEVELCGFLSAITEEPNLHIKELSVKRNYQRKGLARSLIETAGMEARLRGLTTLTLTTFRDLDWNEKYYAKLGFKTLGKKNLTQEMEKHLKADEFAGLPYPKRCAMYLDL